MTVGELIEALEETGDDAEIKVRIDNELADCIVDAILLEGNDAILTLA